MNEHPTDTSVSAADRPPFDFSTLTDESIDAHIGKFRRVLECIVERGAAYLHVDRLGSQVLTRWYPLSNPDTAGSPFMVATVTLEAVCIDAAQCGERIGRAFAATYTRNNGEGVASPIIT